MKRVGLQFLLQVWSLSPGAVVQAEILAMLNYESKPEQIGAQGGD